MKKRKIIALTLLVAFLCSLCIPGTWAIAGNEDNTPPVTENKGMEISKTATPNDDDTYTITLEAYATGEKISTEVTKDVPTDIILVLDQSGSMDKNMNTYDFRPYTNKSNSDYYNLRHNGGGSNLYYQLEDGGYATVAVERSQTASGSVYKECPEWWLNNAFLGTDNYYSNQYNLYVKVGDEYQKVTLKRDGGPFQGYSYIYTFPDGSEIKSRGSDTSPGNFNGKGPLYVKSNAQEYSYTYTYTNKDGVNQVIGTSEGNDTRPTEFTLYERYVTSSITRLEALKNAVKNFSNSVAQKAAGKDGVLGTADDVDHRIAVVGYASRADSNKPWCNTELFIGAKQYNYNVNASDYYSSAFQDMSTIGGRENVTESIRVLDADGATYTNYGLEMANGIFKAYPVNVNEKRNRVIILFSDGYPGKNADDFNSTAADAALAQATTAKNSGVSVYSVGIFNGADATSEGNTNGSNTQAANWFMQNVSSNNGTPQSPSYYLSASDADTLNNIFQQISDNIETGGSGTTLDENAVIKDVISPQFELPVGATAKDITLETYSYTGEGQWGKNNDAMGATAVVNGDQVSVTGFDFAENWCGTETQNGATTYRGNKLVISFPVKAKDGFLGGNGVYTNTSAGVYENSSAEKPLFTFERPQVDVEINDITVTAVEKNVYLLGDLTAEQIQSDATAKVGNVELKLNETNYGLQPWQYEYVNITVTYTDKEGNTLTDLNDLVDNTTYTVSVTVSPKKTDGKATVKTGNGEGKINVFKPELTFKDGEVYYGVAVPNDDTLNANFVPDAMVWKHGDISDENVTMIGTKPNKDAFTITYGIDESKLENGKINSKTTDIPVKVASVKINETDVTPYITNFAHQSCNPACGWNETVLDGDPAFLLHPKTCQLTIKKDGGASDEPYVFNVYKDGAKYSEVTVKGDHSATIVELPVGTYTIEEDTGWSWRYNPSYSGNNVVLSKDQASGTITCKNTEQSDSWLNGYSGVATNIFGVSRSN